jgi:hypothetical protein
MKKTLIATSVTVLSILCATVSLPARADEGDTTFNKLWEMADQNKDSRVTRDEFLVAMGKAYDMKMANMKAAKDAKMMKGDAMTKEGIKSLLNDIYHGA